MLISDLAKFGFVTDKNVSILSANHIRTTEGIKQHLARYKTLRNIPGCNGKNEDDIITSLWKAEQLDNEISSAIKSYLINDLPTCPY